MFKSLLVSMSDGYFGGKERGERYLKFTQAPWCYDPDCGSCTFLWHQTTHYIQTYVLKIDSSSFYEQPHTFRGKLDYKEMWREWA